MDPELMRKYATAMTGMFTVQLGIEAIVNAWADVLPEMVVKSLEREAAKLVDYQMKAEMFPKEAA